MVQGSDHRNIQPVNHLSSPNTQIPRRVRGRVQYASIRFENKKKGDKVFKVSKQTTSSVDNEDENGYLQLVQ